MSLFRKNRSLHQRHAAAHTVAQDALSVFHFIADDLEDAVAEHEAVATDASAQMAELRELHNSAIEAADAAYARAKAVRALVG